MTTIGYLIFPKQIIKINMNKVIDLSFILLLILCHFYVRFCDYCPRVFFFYEDYNYYNSIYFLIFLTGLVFVFTNKREFRYIKMIASLLLILFISINILYWVYALYLMDTILLYYLVLLFLHFCLLIFILYKLNLAVKVKSS